jgi:hypothetical protein
MKIITLDQAYDMWKESAFIFNNFGNYIDVLKSKNYIIY